MPASYDTQLKEYQTKIEKCQDAKAVKNIFKEIYDKAIKDISFKETAIKLLTDLSLLYYDKKVNKAYWDYQNVLDTQTVNNRKIRSKNPFLTYKKDWKELAIEGYNTALQLDPYNQSLYEKVVEVYCINQIVYDNNQSEYYPDPHKSTNNKAKKDYSYKLCTWYLLNEQRFSSEKEYEHKLKHLLHLDEYYSMLRNNIIAQYLLFKHDMIQYVLEYLSKNEAGKTLQFKANFRDRFINGLGYIYKRSTYTPYNPTVEQLQKGFQQFTQIITDANKQQPIGQLSENDQSIVLTTHLILAECHQKGLGTPADAQKAIDSLAAAFQHATQIAQTNPAVSQCITISCITELEKYTKEIKTPKIVLSAYLALIKQFTDITNNEKTENHVKALAFTKALTYYTKAHTLATQPPQLTLPENFTKDFAQLEYQYGKLLIETYKDFEKGRLCYVQAYQKENLQAGMALANGLHCAVDTQQKPDYKGAIEIYQAILKKALNNNDESLAKKVLFQLQIINKAFSEYTAEAHQADITKYREYLIAQADINTLLDYVRQESLTFANQSQSNQQVIIKLDFIPILTELTEKIIERAKTEPKSDILAKAVDILANKIKPQIGEASNKQSPVDLKNYLACCTAWLACCTAWLEQNQVITIDTLKQSAAILKNLAYLHSATSNSRDEINEKINSILVFFSNFELKTIPDKTIALQIITDFLTAVQNHPFSELTTTQTLAEKAIACLADIIPAIAELKESAGKGAKPEQINTYKVFKANLDKCIVLLNKYTPENDSVKKYKMIISHISSSEFAQQAEKITQLKIDSEKDELKKKYLQIFQLKSQREPVKGNPLVTFFKSAATKVKETEIDTLTTFAEEGLREAMLELAEYLLPTEPIRAIKLIFDAGVDDITHIYSNRATARLAEFTNHNPSATQTLAEIYLAILNVEYKNDTFSIDLWHSVKDQFMQNQAESLDNVIALAKLKGLSERTRILLLQFIIEEYTKINYTDPKIGAKITELVSVQNQLVPAVCQPPVLVALALVATAPAEQQPNFMPSVLETLPFDPTNNPPPEVPSEEAIMLWPTSAATTHGEPQPIFMPSAPETLLFDPTNNPPPEVPSEEARILATLQQQLAEKDAALAEADTKIKEKEQENEQLKAALEAANAKLAQATNPAVPKGGETAFVTQQQFVDMQAQMQQQLAQMQQLMMQQFAMMQQAMSQQPSNAMGIPEANPKQPATASKFFLT